MKVSFLGLGIMGSRMAKNLLAGGTALTVWNRSASAANELVAAGAIRADSLAAAVGEADVVFSMLSTPKAVATVFFAEGGALANMHPGAIWVDCTTVDPAFSRQASARATEVGVRFVDAPVAGSKPQAAGAQLAFFVGAGAEDALLVSLRPFLEKMGAKVIPFGQVGQGAAFKMLVNVMLAQSMVIFSESVLLGEALGLDKDFLLDTLPGLVVSAPFTKFKAEAIRADDYEVQFPLEWMHKDIHLATTTAYEAGRPLLLANLTKEIFAAARAAGMGRLDFSAVHRSLAGE